MTRCANLAHLTISHSGSVKSGQAPGAILKKVKLLTSPQYYEIYETSSEWRDYLVDTFSVVARYTDGKTLTETPMDSIDLLHSHKVFEGLPLFTTLRYFSEVARVVRVGGKAVFDVISEDCLDELIIDGWVKLGQPYAKSMLPRQMVIDYFARRGFRHDGSFKIVMGPGFTEYFVFTRVAVGRYLMRNTDMALKAGNVRPGRSLQMSSWHRPKLLAFLLLIILISVASLYLFRKPLRAGVYASLDTVLDYKNRWTMDHSFVLAESWYNSSAAGIDGVLRVSSENPRYFADASGREVYLTGSHTWSNLQDTGAPPLVFDYTQYLDFLTAHGHNFFRLWAWEQAQWGSWTNSEIQFSPSPYQRTGPGTALDGKPKFDLEQFDEEYFARLHARAQEAQNRGTYVSVMLFDGWSIELKDGRYPSPWPGHPYNKANNINAVNGDVDGDGQGSEIHTLASEVDAVNELQKAYIRKVVDTVNDLDNVLYEISNESGTGSTAWQYAMIGYVKEYEATKAKQHPVGMTAQYPNGDNSVLFASPADWISPNNGGGYTDNPPANDGTKVIVADTDHLWGIGGNVPWVWKSVTRGINTLFMDAYDCSSFWPPQPCDTSAWDSLRLNMGYARAYANRMNLGQALPRGELCSTGYCLVNLSPGNAEYLVYQPANGASLTVNLSGVSGGIQGEWLNPDSGAQSAAQPVNGGETASFTPPFNSANGAVLFLYQSPTPVPTSTPTATVQPSPTPQPTNTPKPQGTVHPTATPQAITPTAFIYLPGVEGREQGATVPQ